MRMRSATFGSNPLTRSYSARTFSVRPSLCQTASELIAGVRVEWLQLGRPLELCRRLLVPAEARERKARAVPRAVLLVVEGDCALETLDRILMAPLPLQHVAEIESRRSIVRIERQRTFESRDRRIELVLLRQQESDRAPRLLMSWIDCCNSAEDFQRSRLLLAKRKQLPVPEEQRGIQAIAQRHLKNSRPARSGPR